MLLLCSLFRLAEAGRLITGIDVIEGTPFFSLSMLSFRKFLFEADIATGAFYCRSGCLIGRIGSLLGRAIPYDIIVSAFRDRKLAGLSIKLL